VAELRWLSYPPFNASVTFIIRANVESGLIHSIHLSEVSMKRSAKRDRIPDPANSIPAKLEVKIYIMAAGWSSAII
jgi:hypothetical protein